MPRFLVDEDLPRSLARELRTSGADARDVRDVGLRGKADRAVFEFAVANHLVLLTADLGFANILRFPPGSHAGIAVARFPDELPTSAMNASIRAALDGISDEDLAGSLLIIEAGRIRLRRGTRTSE